MSAVLGWQHTQRAQIEENQASWGPSSSPAESGIHEWIAPKLYLLPRRSFAQCAGAALSLEGCDTLGRRSHRGQLCRYRLVRRLLAATVLADDERNVAS